jgi:hypothetical protein
MKAKLIIDGKEIEVEIAQEEVDKLYKAEKHLWMPKKGETYWYIAHFGYTGHFVYTGDIADEDVLDFGNMYKTQEQAEWAAKEMKEHNKLLAWLANNDDGWVADWDNRYQDKYYLYYDYECKKYDFFCKKNCKSPGTVYMSEANIKKLVKQLNNGKFTL